MLTQFGSYPDKAKAQAFYKVFFMEILIHVLSVVADRNQIKIAGLFSRAACELVSFLKFVFLTVSMATTVLKVSHAALFFHNGLKLMQFFMTLHKALSLSESQKAKRASLCVIYATANV